MSTVPIFAPDGTLGDIPAANLVSAVKAGAKPGVHITAPDGSSGVVPADRTSDAVKAGAKIVPIEDQPIQHPGFWASVGSDLGGMAKGAFNQVGAAMEAMRGNPAPIALQTAQTAQTIADNVQHRKDEGRSAAYQAIAPVGDALGVNTRGMEDAADQGDAAGVAGHAAAAAAPVVAGEVASRAAPALGDALTGPTAARVLKTAGKTALDAATDIPVVRQLAKLKENWGATGPQNIPEADATGENKPFAGGMDEAPNGPAPAPASKVPAKTVRQSKALGPDAQVITQAEALRQPVNDIIDSAVPPEGQSKGDNLFTRALVDYHLDKGDVGQAEAVLDHAAAKTNPSWEPQRPQIVPAVKNIQDNAAMVRQAESLADARTPADAADDRAIQQEMNQDLENHGYRAASEARREFIARNSTGVGKGDLIQQAKGATPPEDLTQDWQKALDAIKNKTGQPVQ